MPWTKTDYPVSIKNLPAAVRNKAIELPMLYLAVQLLKPRTFMFNNTMR